MRSKLALLGFAFAFALLACEQILGLDTFHKCSGATSCDDASSDADIDASDAGDGATDAFILPDGASEASSWARWRMDNTFDEVQSGAPDASLTSFSGPTSLITDAVSGLTWSTDIGKASTVTDASAYCASKKLRLPTRIELVSLLDTTNGAPYITPSFHGPVQEAGVGTLWSSSYVRPVKGSLQFWFIDLTKGDVFASTPSNVGVLCIQ